MAIFSRRTLQQMINENGNFLKKGQTKELVQKLNRMPDPNELTLAPEWEVVLLNAFSKVGIVYYEKNHGGNRNADLSFRTISEASYDFVADITAVSDKGLDGNNSFNALWNELNKKLRGHGLNPNCFRLQVDSHKDAGFKGGPKIRLKLPGSARFSQTIFAEDFDKFIRDIIQNTNSVNRFIINNDDVALEIDYDPNQKYASAGLPSYTVVYSLTENTIYDALQKKASQLCGTGFKGPIGIFLCDGGCSIFNTKPLRGLSFSIDEIIQNFMSIYKEIYFVVTFSIIHKNKSNTFASRRIYSPSIRLFPGEKFNQIRFDLNEILEKLPEVFPSPQREPKNAVNLLNGRFPNIGRSYWGSIGMRPIKNGIEVTVSARALLELLSGKVTQKEFFDRHEYIATEKNPFKSALDRGLLIEKISMKKEASDDDDDWVVIELEGPDPAVSPFIVPEK